MSLVVFAGPTLPAAEIRSRLVCTVLPPAAVGDVLRAVRTAPRAIALLDGVFERVLPVWHKEILWAMAQGVHVFGAASMGALRAAELHAFGMKGVGRIFEAYRDGELEGDDEVAVLHGPAEVGFAAVTEALVNVRATLERAQAERILSHDEARTVLGVAGAIHYRERTWEVLLGRLDHGLAQRLRPWLPGGRVDQKRNDALALLDLLARFLAEDPPPLAVDFAFAWTDAWDALHLRATAPDTDQAVLDELCLQPNGFASLRPLAMLRLLARRECDRLGAAQHPSALAEARERMRARLGLWRRSDLERWLMACDLDQSGFAALVEDEAMSARLEATARAALGPAILAELRAAGAYPALAERARAKARALAGSGLDAVPASEAGVDLGSFLTRLAAQSGTAAGDLDLSHRLGFPDRAALEHAALRELLFLRIMSSKEGAT